MTVTNPISAVSEPADVTVPEPQSGEWNHHTDGLFSGNVNVDRLRPHPEHVRDDLDLNPQFLRSIAAMGVIDPLLIVPDPDREGDYLAVDGHRRMEGARKVGEKQPERKIVPAYLDTIRSGDRAAQHLAQYILNDDKLGRAHTTYQQMEALRLASDNGADPKLIAQATGLTVKDVKKQLKVSRIDSNVLQLARDTGIDSMEGLELFAEFESDEEALAGLAAAKQRGYPPLEHVAERFRQDRAEQAEHDRLVAMLEEAGVPLTEALPDGAVPLTELLAEPGTGQDDRVDTGPQATADDEGDEKPGETRLTFEAHRDCPGRGATFTPYDQTEVRHYCTDPLTHGHRFRRPEVGDRLRTRGELIAAGRTVTDLIPQGAQPLHQLRHAGQDLSEEAHRDCPGAAVRISAFTSATEYCADPEAYGHTYMSLTAAKSAPADPGPARKLVIEGNKAWMAAAKVRADWLHNQLFPRSAAPKQLTEFVTGELLRWPRPLADSFGTYSAKTVFAKLTGKTQDEVLAKVSATTDSKRRLWMLGTVIAAYEYQMAGENDRRATWRTDGKNNPYCSREDAGRYLRFLIDLGYPPSPIEQAVADGKPYTGDAPATESTIVEADADEASTADPAAGSSQGEPDGAGVDTNDADFPGHDDPGAGDDDPDEVTAPAATSNPEDLPVSDTGVCALEAA